MKCKEFCFYTILNAYNIDFVRFTYCFKKHICVHRIHLNHEFYTFIFLYTFLIIIIYYHDIYL